MGRRTPWLLALLLLATPATAQTLHEDYSRASDDYAVLRVMAGRALGVSVEALNASLEREHDDAVARMREASNLSAAMEEGARSNASAATSTQQLRPLAEGAVHLTTNLTLLTRTWAEWDELNATDFASGNDVVRGRLLLSLLREQIDRGYAAADEYDTLGYDTRWLRVALSQFLNRVEAQPLPTLPDQPPGIYLEVTPTPVVLTRPLMLRGVLTDDVPADRVVQLQVDNASVGEVRTDAYGYFALQLRSDALGLGTHTAHAEAPATSGALRSNAVPFEVSRYPTQLDLELVRRTNASEPHRAQVQLVDDDGRALADQPVRLEGPAELRLQGVTDERGVTHFEITTPLRAGDTLIASFNGTGFYAPSRVELQLSEIMLEATPEPRPAPQAQRGWALASGVLLALVLLAAHAGGLEAARRRRPALLPVLAAAGPLVAGALVLWRAGAVPALLTLVIAGVLSIAYVFARSRLKAFAPRDAAGTSGARSISTLHGKEASAPQADVGPLPELSSPATGPVAELMAYYVAMLRRLQQEGVVVGPLTHREVGALLRERRAPEAPLRQILQAIERALYAGVAPQPDDMPRLRSAANDLGVAS